jgi:hypothetical protein
LLDLRELLFFLVAMSPPGLGLLQCVRMSLSDPGERWSPSITGDSFIAMGIAARHFDTELGRRTHAEWPPAPALPEGVRRGLTPGDLLAARRYPNSTSLAELA